ncbi:MULTISPECIES: hypothetical protein [Bacillus cereus group]|uniref:Uncharacterized protein n=1 Tax=Bacillus thuringiensis TaxID=1428 RepID=A0A9X7FXU9_BACTU|nr:MULTISPECIES: hypothetical protein [Bacillus cereus group]PEV64201.1 hypothetical protein CN434_25670 [Bacillus thuringiensis]PFT50772.1 hypothetical protein COK72_01855 [Bacillus thuringiensis]PFY22809.1 hypothetical protein COL44_18175 [Bacillus toyonensis]
MSEYVIYLSSEETPKDVHNSYGYWGGKILSSGGMRYPSIGVCSDKKDVKKYKSKKRAENMAEKLADRCFYVLSWVVEEIE